MSISRNMMMAAAGNAGGAGGLLAIEDVFSTYLYTGNGSTQTITNGIDLAGEGGLVWFKERSSTVDHLLFDTERGASNWLRTNQTFAESTNGSEYFTSFNSDGFTVNGLSSGTNASGQLQASWTFRKAPRFFDVVTYTGNGTDGRTISHNLGIEPGFIAIKQRNNTRDFIAGHTSVRDGGTGDWQTGQLSSTNSFTGTNSVTSADDTTVTLGTGFGVNASGGTYVAYLFAHDPLGPSGDGSDGLISCGSYTGNGNFTTGNAIDVGFEPQWVMIKNASRTDSNSDWVMYDTMRGFTATNETQAGLFANLSNAETISGGKAYQSFITSSGFTLMDSNEAVNFNGDTYIYIAIRRGPMRQPTSGTEVFAIDTRTGGLPSFVSSFPVDMALVRKGITATGGVYNASRLTGNKFIYTNETDAESTDSGFVFDFMNGWANDGGTSSEVISWMFRRAPGFFDVVAYTGDGVAGRTVPHNLGVAPEMIITKARNTDSFWETTHKSLGSRGAGENDAVILNLSTAASSRDGYGFIGDYTDSFYKISSSDFNRINESGRPYIAYLFATLPGVSKVGSYTGNGTSQTIDCGFTSGARFILIKRTDSTGDWYVWDTARGIVAANDPHLSLNTTAAEVTTDDSVDPESSGFIVNQVAATNINVSSGEYIFLAIS